MVRPVDTAALLTRCTFPPAGTAVSCAVSGGADSSALLVLAVDAGCQVTAVHVDHGLREGSADEANRVAALAERFGAAFVALRSPVLPGPNLEARARAARFAVLPDDALLGHTADDQAETMLLNLLRGAGVDGMAGMRPPRHPLLGLRRAETHALCGALGVATVDDESNADPRFRRNRVRAELVPLLDDIADRDVAGVLARQSSLFAELADLVVELSAGLDPTDGAAVTAAPRPLARAAVRRWVRDCTGAQLPIDEAGVRRILEVASGATAATEVAGGWRVARTGGRLRLEAPGAAPPGPTVEEPSR